MDNLWFEVIDATASMRVTLHRSPFHDIGPSSASAYEQSMREDRSLKPTRALRNDIPFPIDEIYREHLTLEAMETVEISFTITAIRNPAVLKSRAGIVSVVDGEGIVPPPGRYRLMFVFIGRIQNDGRLAQKLFRLNPKSISQKHIDAGIMMRGGFVRVEIR
jgi:hypothetical protein